MVLVLIALIALTPKQHSTTTGYVVSRDAFVHNCAPSAVSEEVTETQANQYCGCVYDEGMTQYGGEKFTSMVLELGNSNTMTPELNTIVNDCSTKI